MSIKKIKHKYNLNTHSLENIYNGLSITYLENNLIEILYSDKETKKYYDNTNQYIFPFETKTNYNWLIINDKTYDTKHFHFFYRTICIYGLSFLKIKEIVFLVDKKLNIFMLYLLIYFFSSRITIYTYIPENKEIFVVKDKESFIHIFKSNNQELDIKIYKDNENIKKITRNSHCLYPVINSRNNNIQHFRKDLYFKKCNSFEKILIQDNLLFTEEIDDFPLYSLSIFIRSCNKLIIDYPMLLGNYLDGYFHYNKTCNKKIMRISWLGEEINFSNRIFSINIYVNKEKQKCNIKIRYNPIFSYLTPIVQYLYKSSSESYIMENNMDNPSLLQNDEINKYDFISLVTILLLFISILLRNIVYAFKKNDYMLSTDVLDIQKISKISNTWNIDKFFQDFNFQFFKNSSFFPILIIWNPLPKLLILNSTKCIHSLSFRFITNIIRKVNNYLHIPIIHFHISSKRCKLYIEGDSNHQHLFLFTKENTLNISGLCDFNTRMTLDKLLD